MRREWRYWLRSALPRSLCLVLVFSTILLNTSIESNASESDGNNSFDVVDSSSWKDVENFYGYANYVSLNGIDGGTTYFQMLPMASSSDDYSYTDSSGLIKGQEYYLYKFDIPLRFNLGIDERITLDGEVRFPLLINTSGYGTIERRYYLLATECELYDSEGKRINAGVSTARDGFDASIDRDFGVSVNMRFDKRYIDKEIYGTLTLYISMAKATISADAEPRMQISVSHDSENTFFIDYNDLKYLVGDYEHKEIVSYQKEKNGTGQAVT